ncbi:MAG TPA: glutamate--tRNA ligase [Gammaproteobacteria bacterium]|nr:glutamate--tRNA ligase [Gammaproteobacteria bacterium]
MTVRTRFAPSPTGLLHIGNARTALFSSLYARHSDGAFILRIEDTDAARSELRYVDQLRDDLQWLGVLWQEGLGKEGEYGPYWQSQRQDIYSDYYERLISESLTYPCFCSEEDLALERKLQLSRGQAPRYKGTCRELSAEVIEHKLAQGLKPTLRFRVPSHTIIKFEDLVKGPQSFNSDDIGDFIIRRADGSASFMYCNAIDDALMKVSHVLRGEDHLTNTPRQLMILQALNLHQPQYGHLALLTGDDGTPLSKRHGSFSLSDLRETGYLPQAILNYLGRLGHSYESQEILSFDELAKEFQIKKVSRSAARFDLTQLLHWQKLAVSKLDNVQFWKWLGEKIQSHIPEDMQDQFAETVRPNIVFPQETLKWIEILFEHKINFTEENIRILQQAGEQFFVEAEQAVEQHGADFKNILQTIKTELNLSGKQLYQPLRVALTGQVDGPELGQIAAILGPERMQERFSRAFNTVAALPKAL